MNRQNKQPKTGVYIPKSKPTSEDANDVPATALEHVQPKVSIDDRKPADGPAKDCLKAKEESGDTTPVRQREILIAESAIEAKDSGGIGAGEDTSDDEESYDSLFESDSSEYAPRFNIYIRNLVKEGKDDEEDATYHFANIKVYKTDTETPCRSVKDVENVVKRVLQKASIADANLCLEYAVPDMGLQTMDRLTILATRQDATDWIFTGVPLATEQYKQRLPLLLVSAFFRKDRNAALELLY